MRFLMLLWLCGLSCVPGGSAMAQNYPVKPLRLVAPFFAGGSQILAYLLAEKLGESLGQPVVVDPRTGGGGNLGAEVAARSAPDGYTLVVLSSSHAVSASVFKKLRYDVLKDFAPVSLVASVPQLIVVHPSLPVKTLKELAALGRANPGKLSYGSGGVGSSGHLGGEHFAALNHIKMLHVPYKGGSIALTHILSGEADIVIVTLPATIPFINAGKLRGLAILDTRRTPQLPQLPTSAEAGMPELQVVSWYGVATPAGVPAAIIHRLHKDVVAVMQSNDVNQRLAKVGMETAHSTAAAFGDYIKADVARWAKVIRDAKIQIE
jgi:tripartite-type tricarboxylate transporter receptor subunit TctC